MPVYDYKCAVCAHRFDLIQKISERDFAQCPECEGAAERQVSVVAAPVRGGGGWSSPPPGSPAPAVSPRDRLKGVDTNSLPVVGRDGKLYSADGKSVLRG